MRQTKLLHIRTTPSPIPQYRRSASVPKRPTHLSYETRPNMLRTYLISMPPPVTLSVQRQVGREPILQNDGSQRRFGPSACCKSVGIQNCISLMSARVVAAATRRRGRFNKCEPDRHFAAEPSATEESIPNRTRWPRAPGDRPACRTARQ
jgi:hypothetical protein